MRYADKVAALLSLSRIRTKDDPRRAKLEKRAYQCPHCGQWHLTSKK